MARAESEESMSRMENLQTKLTDNSHVMLVGPAGSGKSSLIKSLIQLCKSSDGSLPCDYSYIPPAGGGMLGGHTLMRQTVDSINTLTFTNNSGWHDWSNKTAVEGLTAEIRGEKAIDDVDRTDTERDASPLKHQMVPHLAFSEVDCIAVVLNGQAGIEGIENLHGLVDACRKNTRRRPSFVITHKDTMSDEQIEHMKTALETKYGLDPYKIFFIESVTTPNQEIVGVNWKSRLFEFLEVCAVDGKVGADLYRMRENAMLKKEEGQHEDEQDRIQKEIVDAKYELDIMNILVTTGHLDADTANKMVHREQKQVDMLNRELKHAKEMHILKTECNNARQIIRETSKQRGWEFKWHQLKISELQQKLHQSTAICDNLVYTKASLQGQLKDERDSRNHAETTLKNELRTKGDCISSLEKRIKMVQDTAQQQHEHTKSEYERELLDLVPKADELRGATARVLNHEEQTDTQNTEEDEEKEEKEEDYIEMGIQPHETDKANAKPIKMECCKRVGVEGGKLQLDSFGIELEIPPGAIDSEAPQEICLRVLTDTPNLGNGKKEMSVCFGVQCLARNALILKSPVIYTIPHCAVITPFVRVKAVLYMGKGKYSPDAVVIERIKLSRSGTPSINIKENVLKLQMDQFSWVKIKLKISKIWFQGKKMCCQPFKEKNLALQKTSVILHAHLYDDIKGNSELVKRQEGENEFIPVFEEQEVLIQKSSVDLKITCYVKKTAFGGPTVVSFDKLMSGNRICKQFGFDFSNQSDSVAVSLKIGHNKTQDLILFRLEDRRERATLRDQEELQSASSSQTLQTSNQSRVENILGGQRDFDEILTKVATKVVKRHDIDGLGKALGFEPEDIERFVDTNLKNGDVSYMGTLSMLREWKKKQTRAKMHKALNGVLKKAGQIFLADELFDTSSDMN